MFGQRAFDPAFASEHSDYLPGVGGKLGENSDKLAPVIGFLAEESDKAANDPAYAPSKAEAFMQLMEIEINLIS